MKLEKAAKKDKKRKSKGGKDSGGKKSKKNDGGAALKSAQEKHATIVAGTKPLFIQPPNLADGCVLKDYQLEGVRWLVSLFENGVSGILADEVRNYSRDSDVTNLGSNLRLVHRWGSARLFKLLL
jgi:ATP-dependent DNA helicase